MTNTTKRLRIAGTGHYLPERVITNEYFEREIDEQGKDKGPKRFYEFNHKGERTSKPETVTAQYINEITGGKNNPQHGILERRYISPGETPSSMGLEAAIQAINEALQTGDLDSPKNLAGIIVGTVTENENFPSAACKIQEGIEQHYKTGPMPHCEAVDLAAACAGGVLGIRHATGLNQLKEGNYLVIGAEDVPSMFTNDDRNKMLFGAGAGALLLTPSTDERGIIATYAKTEVHDGRLTWINRDPQRKGRMAEGRKVMIRGTRAMIQASQEVKEQAGWEKADIYIPHQANGRMLDGIEEKVTGEGATVYRTIHKTGNTSAATCLSAIDMARKEGIIKPGTKVVIPAVGGGLAISAAAIQF